MKAVRERLALLFVLAALALNFPVLAIFNRGSTWGGIPILYLYLFGVWVVAIAAAVALAWRPWDDEE